jgi:hypothetical protein
MSLAEHPWYAGLRETAAAFDSLSPELGGYVGKTRDELDPFLNLSPYIFGVATEAAVSARFLIELRPLPVHIFGIVKEISWADGQWCSPADYFYHDLDHARYKIREDMLALGYPCPDVDEDHRTILPYVQEYIAEAGPKLWSLVPQRSHLAQTMLNAIDALAASDHTLAQAAELLLFEMVHEKSLPMDRSVLEAELASSAHVNKICTKHGTGFYGESKPDDSMMARLDDARNWLSTIL